jgi:hemerythrin-like domain-containing protein
LWIGSSFGQNGKERSEQNDSKLAREEIMSNWLMNSRRRFLEGFAAASGGLILTGCLKTPEGTVKNEDKLTNKNEKEEEVSPAEDLMREHGILKRVLLIYREGIRRIDSKENLPPEVLTASANLIRRFIEDYHEKLEEEHLFPRFRKAGSLVELVDVLEQQHKRGRGLTDTVVRLASPSTIKDQQERRKLRDTLQLFVRMYEPHEAREDTVLFPAFRRIVSSNEYDALGEDFEKKEYELFGDEGFERNVEEVSKIEKILGIYDLAQFTAPG